MAELAKFNIDMLKVAQLSVEVFALERRRKFLNGELGAAYYRWKMLNGVDRVERETRSWTRMMSATKKEYAALVEAKRIERNARRRLETAILRVNRTLYEIADAMQAA